MNTRRILIGMLLFFGALFGKPLAASAQYSAPQNGSQFQSYVPAPTVSPYLNLLNNTNPAVTNYQSLVRPMVDERDMLARQGGSINQIQQQQRRTQSSGKRSPLDDRVQAARFLNYSHYYSDTRR